MSGTNPYATNGYSGSNSNLSNPYANTGGRYVDPYLQNNQSNASIDSYGSRDRDRRRRSNPYITTEQNPPGSSDSRRAGGYGGLGQTTQDHGYDGTRERERTRTPQQHNQDYERPSAPYLAQAQQQQSPGPGTRDRERSGGYNNDSHSRERRDGRSPAFQQDDYPPSLPRNGYSATSSTPSPAAPRITNFSSSRRPTKSMDDILRYIQSNWSMMAGDECVPVKVALQLMDPSSLGLADKEIDFSDTHVDLQKCLKGVVNEHYADFNSAVGTYHKIQNAIHESQHRVRFLKGGLMSVKGGMLSTRPELRGLAETSGKLDDMIGMLGVIEELKGVSGKLEEKISEKKFLGAVELLMDSLRGLRRGELEEIGSMADMRSYFANQETSLIDILVEELHDHLYLKSPYCAERWQRRKTNGDMKEARDAMIGEGVNAWDRPVYHYLSNLDTSSAMIEDASKNPEADTFYYMHMILESLNKLGHLDEAITRIEQRMPLELNKVVEKTINEIDMKYPTHLRGQLNKKHRTTSTSIKISDGRSQVLSDFLWTLYSKFEAIAEGHRVLHEVITGVATREGLTKSEKHLGSFKELWKLYQMEMRSILHDYLAADGDTSLGTGLTSATSADVFARQPRDKSKRMFKLSEMDEKSITVRTEEEELAEILKSSVPGLVSKPRSSGTNTNSNRHGQDTTAAGHKLLIEPGVFNIIVLLPSTLTFLQNLRDIVPPSSHIPMSTLTSFLDDFLINVFHPQLEEAITELCTRCIIDIEAYTEDPMWSKYSPRPIFKGTVAFMMLIRSFSDTLCSIPQDQMFTQLVINQLVAYYDKCIGFYKAIVSKVVSTTTNSTTTKAAAAFAESGDVHDIAVELLKSQKTSPEQRNLIQNEVQYLLSATKASPLSSYDIVSDTKSIQQISLLYNSIQWMSSALSQLRHVDNTTTSTKSHSRNTSQTHHARRWTLIKSIQTSTGVSAASNPSVLLPLTNETVIAFDHTLSSYRNLAQNALLTLHINIRCNIIVQLSQVLRGPDLVGTSQPDQNTSTSAPTSAIGNVNTSNPATPLNPPQLTRIDSASLPPLSSGLYPFVLPSPPTSASPLILNLNSDLITFESSIAGLLGSKERRFITLGLARLVDRYMIIGADRIQVMNNNGAERIRVDAMVLQQNLRGIVASSNTSDEPRTKMLSQTPSDIKKAGTPNGATLGNRTTSEDISRGLGISTAANRSPSPNPAAGSEAEDNGLLTLTHLYYSLFLEGPDSVMSYVRETHSSPTSKSGSNINIASNGDGVSNGNAIAIGTAITKTTSNEKANSSRGGSPVKKAENKKGKCAFTYDELRTLIELCFSARLRGDDREESIKARKRMGEILLELGEIMWDS